jgi:hypothetical protein
MNPDSTEMPKILIIEDDEDFTNPQNLFTELIRIQRLKEEKNDIWKDSPYKDFVKLQSNNAGIVGERFIQNICSITGLESSVDGAKTKQIGGGSFGDGLINGKSVEIKTAHQGSTSPSFQHELGEMPWNAQYMMFIDIAPQCIYLTLFANFTEEEYKSGEKCSRCFPSKSVTWRKQKGAFKLDTTVTINENNVSEGNTFKILQTTPFAEIKKFIISRIV